MWIVVMLYRSKYEYDKPSLAIYRYGNNFYKCKDEEHTNMMVVYVFLHQIARFFYDILQ